MQRVARGEGLIRLGLLRTLGVDFVPRLAVYPLPRGKIPVGISASLSIQGLPSSFWRDCWKSNSTWRSAPSLRRRFNSQPFLRAVRMWS